MNILSVIQSTGNRLEETAFWLLPGFEILLVPAMYHWLPGSRQSRGGTFFNVRVEPGFANSGAGRAILHRFRWRIWSWAAILVAIYFLGSLRLDIVMIPFGITLLLYATMISCLLAFSAASRQTRKQAAAVAGPSVRTATLFIEEQKVDWWVATLEWLGMLLPLAIPGAAAAILTLHSKQLPANDAFRSLTWVLWCFLFGLIPAGTQFALRFHARSSDWNPDPRASRKYRTVLGALTASVFTFFVLDGCLLALIPVGPAHNMDSYFAFTHTALPIVFVLAIGIRWWLKRNLSRESIDPMPDGCWKWGFFYVNPDDPALVVPSRSGTGHSFNYGQRVVWLLWGTATIGVVLSLVQA